MPHLNNIHQGLITSYYSDTDSKKSKQLNDNNEIYQAPKISFPSAFLTNDIKDKLEKNLISSCANGKKEEKRIFYGIDSQLPHQIAVISLGAPSNVLYEKKEAVRKAAAIGFKSLQSNGVKEFILDPPEDIQSFSEGTILASYSYTKFEKRRKNYSFKLCPSNELLQESQVSDYKLGLIFGSMQNLVRYLADSPANKCTPSAFVSFVSDFSQKIIQPIYGSSFSKIFSLEAKDVEWAKKQGMGAFLSVASGSDEPAKFLIIEYHGACDNNQSQPIALIGKGVTFDSGGISLKSPTDMSSMKADMQGAAIVTASILTAAYMKLPINMVALVPLTENLPSGKATKPGDVVKSHSGKTIEVRTLFFFPVLFSPLFVFKATGIISQ